MKKGQVEDGTPAGAMRQARRLGAAASPVHLRALVVCLALPLSHPARAQASRGFDFCAPPHRPSCVFDEAKANGCDREVEAYVATVFRYRECLERESERAVRESNDVIDHWRCRQTGERCRR